MFLSDCGRGSHIGKKEVQATSFFSILYFWVLIQFPLGPVFPLMSFLPFIVTTLGKGPGLVTDLEPTNSSDFSRFSSNFYHSLYLCQSLFLSISSYSSGLFSWRKNWVVNKCSSRVSELILVCNKQRLRFIDESL